MKIITPLQRMVILQSHERYAVTTQRKDAGTQSESYSEGSSSAFTEDLPEPARGLDSGGTPACTLQ